MARTSKGLVQTVPSKAFKKGTIPKALQRKGWRGSDKQLAAFAELVGKVRRGDVSKAAQTAVLAESVTKLTSGTYGKQWTAFFKKHGGDDLVAVEFVQGLPMAELLQASSLPRMANKAGDRMVIYEFVRIDKATLGARFHVVDRGAYQGTLLKAIAPIKPLVTVPAGQEGETQLRMITAGIPQHAHDLLQEALGVSASAIDRDDPINQEIAMLSSKAPVIRGTGPWSKFKWPKGIDVRKPTGILNLLR